MRKTNTHHPRSLTCSGVNSSNSFKALRCCFRFFDSIRDVWLDVEDEDEDDDVFQRGDE